MPKYLLTSDEEIPWMQTRQRSLVIEADNYEAALVKGLNILNDDSSDEAEIIDSHLTRVGGVMVVDCTEVAEDESVAESTQAFIERYKPALEKLGDSENQD